MARPREFDRERALTIAMQLFWSQGYDATAMPQLLDVMGIGRSSFYATFSDKRSLFVEALERFADRTHRILQNSRETAGATYAVSLFFHATLAEVPAHRLHMGCLMVNTILEQADVDDGLSKLAVLHLGKIERAFADCVAESIALGELQTASSPKQLARHLMLINQGLRVASRTGLARKELLNMANTALLLIGLPGMAVR